MHPGLTTKLALGAALAASHGLKAVAAETPPGPPMPGPPGSPAATPPGHMVPPPAPLFKHMDANGEGEAIKAEAMAFAEQGFNMVDKNDDGAISAKEILDRILAGPMAPDAYAR